MPTLVMTNTHGVDTSFLGTHRKPHAPHILVEISRQWLSRACKKHGIRNSPGSTERATWYRCEARLLPPCNALEPLCGRRVPDYVHTAVALLLIDI